MFIRATVLTVLLSAVAADSAEIPEKAVNSNNTFAAELLEALDGEKGNVFVSPLSAHAILALTSLGAKGKTLEEMREVLHLADDAVAGEVGRLSHRLDSTADGGAIANALWIQRGYELRDTFMASARKDFGARPETVDFAGDRPAALKKVNGWVSDRTKGKITELLQENDVSSLTRVILTNAIYFKGDWERAFEEKATRPGTFHQADGGTSEVPFMHQSETFGYGETKALQILEMPYKKGGLSMVVLLPKEGVDLAEARRAIAKPFDLSEQEVVVTFPKFRLKFRSNLKKALESMGMKMAFDARAADFSRMTEGNDLFVSAVIQEAFVDVNEKGTEAAAATGVVMALRGVPRRVEFTADRPFVYLIRDKASGAVLFAGWVVGL